MWQRAQLKQKAKNALRGSYWKALIVSFVIGIFTSGGKKGAAGRRTGNSGGYGTGSIIRDSRIPSGGVLTGFLIVLLILLTVSIGMLIIKLLIGYNIQVGGRKYFIQAAQGEVEMGYLGYGFKEGRYMNIVKTMFIKDLYTFLWTLLFIVPGIIKSYSYAMVPYILADNPGMSTNRAIELSTQMTNGEKWDMFVLKLSFIGWYILGTIACLVGVVFVHPYKDATHAELYLVLRKQAIDKGLCDYQELNLVKELKAIDAEWQ
ncbi:MAG: DUF975 family protein [Epulopiscium sp.]|nr:DUF975 family protein [Candidatus Epulonipiscium sp.]